ncbi:uncharacterized protein MYCFIDRAFT_75652 [Pseudocercospora fijiensis CIRAD86]|uniref:Uncharacterized protein n=1 Tax=Pseudocercospora fijiensis (strain CIRAD86) TaxID=383855 RepID=N1Q6A3_PSEFD|nr:uncharacterized protein MYCFIDRAFT_75652 [Pseudocercospora fijiensis CIRAD86]EME87815.1 hypothetical protein MYCFIDRAFT_75652 [Pseudocercospora fijiensis CIRAD86]
MIAQALVVTQFQQPLVSLIQPISGGPASFRIALAGVIVDDMITRILYGSAFSLKAETSKTEPTDQDRPNKGNDGDTLKQKAQEKLKKNPSALGDPVSLKAETSDNFVVAILLITAKHIHSAFLRATSNTMLPTPPPTEKKAQGMFAERQRKLRYYEDAYGRRNADEGAEGRQDLCESEPDSEDEVQRDEQHRRKTPGRQSHVDRSSEPEESDDSEISESVYLDRPQYKIAPNVNGKRSLTEQEYDTAKSDQQRLGMFGSAAPSAREPRGRTADSDGYFMSGGRGRGDSPISLAGRDKYVFNERAAPTGKAKRTRDVAAVVEDIEEAPRKRTRVRRPAHRQLIKAQLQEKAREERCARRAAAKASQCEKAGKGGSIEKKESAKKIRACGKGGKKSGKRGSGTMRAAVVVIDNSHINFAEYERFEQ